MDMLVAQWENLGQDHQAGQHIKNKWQLLFSAIPDETRQILGFKDALKKEIFIPEKDLLSR